ncbi:MAG: YwiC-like family protein [Thermodesulfovibrionia bacterium]|nr:YwiC-like family protein [Thermodesulfovibrionia bacterium]
MRVPLVKEHGAWFVFIFSCAAGILAGQSISWDETLFNIILTSAGIALLINSKASLAPLVKGRRMDKTALAWTVLFFTSGLLLLLPFLEKGLPHFNVFFLLIILYLFFIGVNKEHLLIAELSGFSLLTISAPIIYFMATGVLSLKLYLAVFLFFGAGVFKVRMRIKKTAFFRAVMVTYCSSVLIFYYYSDISCMILLPLVENITNAIWFRDERLKVTGNVELVKGVMFLTLLYLFYI